MFFVAAPEPKPNDEESGIVTVYIRGAIEHHDEGSGGDSYDQIRERAAQAFEDGRAVVLRIDSPGGVVSGLNECVRELQRMRAEYRKPLVAFADEMATSAAYALCCACDEVFLPRSAIVGSIGVISTMVSCVEADKKDGLAFAILTSGERKADGHPHAEISDSAIAAEQSRVDDLARQFWKIASKARGLSVGTIRGYQCGLFMGRKAERAGLADGVMGCVELYEALAMA